MAAVGPVVRLLLAAAAAYDPALGLVLVAAVEVGVLLLGRGR